MMEDIILMGAGGHCKVIIDIIKSNNTFNIVGILDPQNKGFSILDIPIIGDDDLLIDLKKKGVSNAFICIGAMGSASFSVRNNLFVKLRSIGFKLPKLIHRNAVVSDFSSIGDGSCVMAGAIVNAGAIIGENCIINTGVIIEHECIIRDNTHISPGVSIAGGVKIGSNTHIGIGSTIIQGINIGDSAVIGAGAAVISDISHNSVAIGVPAKIIRCR